MTGKQSFGKIKSVAANPVPASAGFKQVCGKLALTGANVMQLCSKLALTGANTMQVCGKLALTGAKPMQLCSKLALTGAKPKTAVEDTAHIINFYFPRKSNKLSAFYSSMLFNTRPIIE